MYSLFCPRMIVDSLFEIDIKQLQQLGIKGIIFDLDNTIIPWNSAQMCPRIATWLHNLAAAGFKLTILSNNWNNERVRGISARFNIPFIAKAYKPSKTGFRNALLKMELKANEVAVIGDQLFTDVLGGNRSGLYTIWVKPLTTQEFIGTKIHRQFEKLAVRILRAKGLIK